MKNKKLSKNKIIHSPGEMFENSIMSAIDQLSHMVYVLGEEYEKMMNVNSMLINSSKAMKQILIKRGLTTEGEFDKLFKKSVKEMNKDMIKINVQQEEMYKTYMLEEYPAANS